MTYGEIVFICKDLLKIISDDATFEDEHIIWLANRFRNMLVKRYYDTPKKTLPDSMYQTICLNLTYCDNIDVCGAGDYLMSEEVVPYTNSLGENKVYPVNYFLGNIDLTSREKFKYAGNKYTKSIIFATIGLDNHLYLKSGNNQFLALEKVRLTAVFDDMEEATKMLCDKEGCCCTDINEERFPLEDALVPELIEMIIRELATGIYHPTDNKNNAKDDLSDIMQFIRQNMKDKYLKEYGGE